MSQVSAPNGYIWSATGVEQLYSPDKNYAETPLYDPQGNVISQQASTLPQDFQQFDAFGNQWFDVASNFESTSNPGLYYNDTPVECVGQSFPASPVCCTRPPQNNHKHLELLCVYIRLLYCISISSTLTTKYRQSAVGKAYAPVPGRQ
jgi:hypothetical protein